MHERELVYIFQRDFSQWMNELIRHHYVVLFPEQWGRGLEDQMIHYTGRATRWYRYADDFAALGEYITDKTPNFYLFDKTAHQQFLLDVEMLRTQISTPVSKEEMHSREHLDRVAFLFSRMYSIYTFSVFLAGVWQEQYLRKHGSEVRPVIEMVYQSRVKSEGLVKACDLYVREWIADLVEIQNYPRRYATLLRTEEIKKLLTHNVIPDRKILDLRQQGYFYMNDTIYPTTNLGAFLHERGLHIREQATSPDEIRGQVACQGGVIRGRVKMILNSNEVKDFPSGAILVTAMTSPEYLPAMKGAAAIITDEGGVTCHAAITSRELGVPCVIGTKIATRVLKDGDMVEVDATKGIVRKLQ